MPKCLRFWSSVSNIIALFGVCTVFKYVPVAFVFSVRDPIATIQLLVVIPITPLPPAREMLHLIFFPLFFILASMFTSAWRKLRAKVGHAWDKCCYICQRNQTTQLAGTIHAHHVRGWEVFLQPDNCLQATFFLFVCFVFGVFWWTIHQFTLMVPTQSITYSALTAGSSKKESKIRKELLLPFHPILLEVENHFFLKLCWGNYTQV